MQDTPAVRAVLTWLDAVNRQDSAQLVAVSDPQIEIVGPRGAAYGHDVLCAWLSRAGVRLATQRMFARDTVVVVAHHGVWQSAATGGQPSEADVTSVFRVQQGQVVHYARYDSLYEALTKAGLSEADQIERG